LKIFVTIGTQEPFDRLLEMAEKIAEEKTIKIIAQNSKLSKFNSKQIELVGFLKPNEFDYFLKDADLIISHAGMGTIISTLLFEKSLIVVPREYKFREHRSDHQNATANYFKKEGLIQVARTYEELSQLVFSYLNRTNSFKTPRISEFAEEKLISTLKRDIEDLPIFKT
jgi:UDP-N-acetylglucosamine transferase subunit ALG13